MPKSFVTAVLCDREGKLISIDKCLKCKFYLNGELDIEDGFIECGYDKLKYRNELEKQYKEYGNYKYLEFGSEGE